MPVPKSKTSRSRRNMRRAHHALKAPNFSVCKNCGELHLPHHVCSSCGFYNGRQVLANKAGRPQATLEAHA